jgi:hypothetical protein
MLKVNSFIRNVVLLTKNNFIMHYANKTVYSNVFSLLLTPFFTVAPHAAVTFQTPIYNTVGTLGVKFFCLYFTVMLWLCTY